MPNLLTGLLLRDAVLKDFDESKHPRVPGGSPEGGQFTSGGAGGAGAAAAPAQRSFTGPGFDRPIFGGTPAGYSPADAARFQELKAQYAHINDEILPHLDNPASPEVQKAMDQLKGVVKEMHALHADVGGVAGVGMPGGPRDLVIVGGGPGGLQSAISGAYDGLDTLFIEAQPVVGGQSKYSSRLENVPGFPVGVAGDALAPKMYEQATRLGAEGKLGVRVTGLTYDPGTHLKTLTLSNGERVETRAVILAGGLEARTMTFPGADSKSVTYLDGKAVTAMGAGGPVVVVGGGNSAAQAALGAAQKASRVYLMSRSPLKDGMSDLQVSAVKNNPRITVMEGDQIGRLGTDERGQQILTTAKGQNLPAKAVGIFIGSLPKTDWLPASIQRDTAKTLPDGEANPNRGKIVVDPVTLETGMPGVFAIGDQRVNSIGRVGMAVGDALMAEHHVFDYFKQEERHASSSPSQVTKANGKKLSNAEFNATIDQLWALDKANPWFGQSYEPDPPESVDSNGVQGALGQALFQKAYLRASKTGILRAHIAGFKAVRNAGFIYGDGVWIPVDKEEARVPAGSPGGGEWTAGGGAEAPAGAKPAKLTETQKEVVRRLTAEGGNIKRFPGGTWTTEKTPWKEQYGPGSAKAPEWNVAVGTIHSMEKAGMLERANVHPEEWRDERRLTAAARGLGAAATAPKAPPSAPYRVTGPQEPFDVKMHQILLDHGFQFDGNSRKTSGSYPRPIKSRYSHPQGHIATVDPPTRNMWRPNDPPSSGWMVQHADEPGTWNAESGPETLDAHLNGTDMFHKPITRLQ